ncbi:hypothetical protein D3C72_1913360 [compost metagenome]
MLSILQYLQCYRYMRPVRHCNIGNIKIKTSITKILIRREERNIIIIIQLQNRLFLYIY